MQQYRPNYKHAEMMKLLKKYLKNMKMKMQLKKRSKKKTVMKKRLNQLKDVEDPKKNRLYLNNKNK